MVDHSKIHHHPGAETEPRQPVAPERPVRCRPFAHRDLLQSVRPDALISGKKLLNALHYIHFMNGELLVHADDPQYGESFLLRARIEACLPDEITCRWAQDSPRPPEGTQIRHLIACDGLSLIAFPVSPTGRNGEGFTTPLPDAAHLIGKRSIKRYAGHESVSVELTQSGFLAQGELIDFTPLAFRVRLTACHGNSFIRMNRKSECTVRLQLAQRILYSGPCRLIRLAGGLDCKELVLAPTDQSIFRFEKRKSRNPRIRVFPPPTAIFLHPLSCKPVQLDICNLTVAGLAVEEQVEESVLLPGMIIPGMEIRYAETLRLNCDCQVIYRQPCGPGVVRCGMAILDMDFRSYLRLGHIIAHTEDPHAAFQGNVEMEALWEFFFDSGFIYPKKYQMLQDKRNEFKHTYEKLYLEDQEIAAHFILEQNGRIYGHVSMVRAYQKAWMIHHLAARPLKGKRLGLSVLKHILRFFEGLYRYPSIRMDHMIFYFRPENRFPNLFFGGFARDMNNPQLCSLDLFSCITVPAQRTPLPLPEKWRLSPLSSSHFADLERFYRKASGGLLLDVLRLNTEDDDEPLESVYRRHGFIRQCHTHALTQGDALIAVLIDNRSDLGLNLSELLNCVKVIAIAREALPWEVLTAALSQLTCDYPAKTVPLMIYPDGYPAERNQKVDKKYLLWIMSSEQGKVYREYMERKIRMALRYLFKHLLAKLVRR